jgi:hypothetical protein
LHGKEVALDRLTPQSPVEPQRAETIDFDALRAQAAIVLERLQQSRERKLASVARSVFDCRQKLPWQER